MEIAGDWAGAARAWAILGCPYEQAIVLGLYGGAPEQRESFEILERLGAVPALQALRRRLQNLGVRGVPRGARPSTKEHPFRLTRREAQILELLRGGLSNPAIAKRLFVSARTVDHHVSAVLAKLGATTRAEAIEISRRRR
jgi:DNA-binding NarL/FixJ family response regulator